MYLASVFLSRTANRTATGARFFPVLRICKSAYGGHCRGVTSCTIGHSGVKFARKTIDTFGEVKNKKYRCDETDERFLMTVAGE